MALPASDPLTHAGGILLTTYSANWTQQSTGGYGNMTVDVNGAYPSVSGAGTIAIWNADAFPADQYSQATWTFSGNTLCFPQLLLRCTVGASPTCYIFNIRGDGTGPAWQKTIAGTTTAIGPTPAHTFASGDVVRAQINGTVLSVYVNGSLLFQFADASIASGAAGIGGYSTSINNATAMKTWSAGAAPPLVSNWGTKIGIDFRATLGYITADPTNCVFATSPGGSPLPPYPVNLAAGGNIFLAGYVLTATGAPIGSVDGARDRNAGVDPRLAGKNAANSGTANVSYKIQLGSAPGRYAIWLAFCDQGVGVTLDHTSAAVRDSNGTLFTVTVPASLTVGQVVGADSTLYANAPAWVGTPDTSGASMIINTTDTSNGNGGPFIFIDCGGSSNQGIPLAHVAVQFIGGPVPLFYYRKTVLLYV